MTMLRQSSSNLGFESEISKFLPLELNTNINWISPSGNLTFGPLESILMFQKYIC